MVFLIQRAQNNDTLAVQIKVNELIAQQKGAHDSLIAIEQFSQEELRTLQNRFVHLPEVAYGGGATSVATVPCDTAVPRADSAHSSRAPRPTAA